MILSQPFTSTFFSYVEGILQPYLKKYQSDKPMVPYMYADLKALMKDLQIIAKRHKRYPLVCNVSRSAAIFDPTLLVFLPKTILIK